MNNGKTRIVIFGATVSIGTQALDIISKSKNLTLCGFSYYSNDALARKIKNKYKLNSILKSSSNITEKEISNYIKKTKPDLIVNAVVGFAGITYSFATIKNKIDLALANKETLVCAGKFFNDYVIKYNINVYPIDSEHSALYQLIHHRWTRPISYYYITASGGPFWEYDKDKLLKVTYSQAIKNPNWKMGAKVSVDSATLINKAYEMLEAYWLFNNIEVSALVQRKSLIHAFVQFENNQFGVYEAKADMHWPIELALNRYTLHDNNMKQYKTFKDIPYKLTQLKNKYLKGYTYGEAMLKQPTSALPIIINAADEEAIVLFKQNKINFLQIYELIDKCIKEFKHTRINKLSDVYTLDKEVRKFIKK